ncbi:SurA N-terminal domain-containing protein [Streptomyces sp. NPDC050145]|uniref:SurA N-terminal domain-containing protein n=1 Tax=Streptomyces sp. NPDC050145 TaxID=3365602 RepID=UPI0037890597
MHRRNSRRTALVLSAAALAATPFLTACGNEAHPGAAAVVGGQRITVSQLDARVTEVRDAQQAATRGDTQYGQAVAQSGPLTRSTLNAMVRTRVLHRAATDAGVTVTRAETQAKRAEYEKQVGGAEQLEAAFLQQFNIPPQRLTEAMRSEVEAGKLIEAIGADPQTPQGQAAFAKALADASKELGVSLNPRYGTWDAKGNKSTDARVPWLNQVTKQPATQPA